MADDQEGANVRFGANVKLHRERKELSGSALAKLMTERGCKWHQSTVARVEAGHQSVRIDEAEALSEILGVSIQMMLWAGPEANAAEHVRVIIGRLNRSWHEAAQAVAVLTAAQQSAERMIESARDSKYERVRMLAGELQGEVEDRTLESAIAEGTARFKEVAGDDEPEPDEESEPGLVDQGDPER